jgi:antitoxin Phd
MATWQVQQAKSRLSEVIEDANTKGPQIISRHGTDRAVVLSINDFDKLTKAKAEESQKNFIEFLLSGPKFEDDDPIFDIERTIDPERELDLDD